jgi:hypothetical protein
MLKSKGQMSLMSQSVSRGSCSGACGGSVAIATAMTLVSIMATAGEDICTYCGADYPDY